MQLVSFATIQSAVTIEQSLMPVRESFKSFSLGNVNVPSVQHLEMPYEKGGALHIKSAHIRGHKFCLVKIASTFPNNASLSPPIPSIDGVILMFSVVTGKPVALLEDRAWITQIRTAAAGAVAAKALAPLEPTRLGVIGAGTQASLQVESIVNSMPSIAEILVWGRSTARLEKFVDETGKKFNDKTVRKCKSVHSCALSADIVITATYAQEPLLFAGDVKRGALVIGVGSDSVLKCEISPLLIRGAKAVVVDSRRQNEILGDVGRGIRDGIFDASRIDAELGEVLIDIDKGKDFVRGETIVCKLTGIAAQEAFVCDFLMNDLGFSGDVE